MAIIHQASITPTKAELVAAWLPDQPWYDGPAAEPRPVGAYRFDDPAGEVGIEAHLFEVGDRQVHVPLTYRAAALEGAQDALVGTMEHSVLGTRWVYDGPADPVFRAELTRVILEAGTQVEMFVQTPDGPVRREPNMTVRGSGTAGTPDPAAGPVVVRYPGRTPDLPSRLTLTGTWEGQDEPVVLAYLPEAAG
ncbi:hypothetical protein HFP15_08480 [Amycolatopsis sp. K13G38]|uniref:Maltokinase N-terminal cap domain-containing protein n=1 Tax=Amycolatopsis acididurans TaxID=2724524 RepID=A0ABX1J3I3_9PSEU|nr:hypothetical protein [Amycolatopsis acididurans]NKQ52915.1 hypothetical protein [Amycolatopsis acididurans]